MCFRFLNNLIFGIIISALFLIFFVLITLMIVYPNKFIKSICNLNSDYSGVCVNASQCFSGQDLFIENNCNYFDGFTCCSIDNVITKNEEKFVKHINFRHLNTAHCGTSKNGNFDHVVDLGFQNGANDVNFTCSGSLINHHFVLTSAQCAMPAASNTKL